MHRAVVVRQSLHPANKNRWNFPKIQMLRTKNFFLSRARSILFHTERILCWYIFFFSSLLSFSRAHSIGVTSVPNLKNIGYGKQFITLPVKSVFGVLLQIPHYPPKPSNPWVCSETPKNRFYRFATRWKSIGISKEISTKKTFRRGLNPSNPSNPSNPQIL